MVVVAGSRLNTPDSKTIKWVVHTRNMASVLSGLSESSRHCYGLTKRYPSVETLVEIFSSS
jgi:hypothetical protein